jgi:response regulator RpfG family c-di-GMP phosphodiesterase
MEDKILFVDDDSNLLESFKRQLRNRFPMETASDGLQGLEVIKKGGPFAVVVSDFRMPNMNGVQFLNQVRDLAPDSARILLTGFADLKTTIDAVNQGNIFRLLTKPCQPEILENALRAGVKQYQLTVAEQVLLEKTLKGAITVLCEILSLANQEAFGRALRVTRIVREIATMMGVAEIWHLETASMLSQIGCIMLPEGTLTKISKGATLSPEEMQVFQTHPLVASDLIAKIPRMEKVVEIINYQGKNFDGSGVPNDDLKGEGIPIGARILKVALDYDSFKLAGKSKEDALAMLQKRAESYDPKALSSLEFLVGIEGQYETICIPLADLRENMILGEAIRDGKGLLLVAGGQEISQTLVTHLKNFASSRGVKEPIRVMIPLKKIALSRPSRV